MGTVEKTITKSNVAIEGHAANDGDTTPQPPAVDLASLRAARAQAFGSAVWLLSQSKELQLFPLGGLGPLLNEPLKLGQFKLYRKGGVPVGFAIWAFLNDAVAARLTSGASMLTPEEWQCGDQAWVVMMTSTEKTPDFIREDLTRNVLAGRDVHFVQDTVKIEVRPLTPDDLSTHQDQAVELARLIHGQSRRQVVTFDANKIVKLAQSWLSDPAKIVLSAWRQGNLLGVFIGRLERYIYGSDLLAIEVGFAVRPDDRGHGTGKLLVQAFEAWARDKGAREIMFIHTSAISPEAAEAVYGSTGATKVGAVFAKMLRVKRGEAAEPNDR